MFKKYDVIITVAEQTSTIFSLTKACAHVTHSAAAIALKLSGAKDWDVRTVTHVRKSMEIRVSTPDDAMAKIMATTFNEPDEPDVM